jgi:hypothetical protein
MHDAAASAFPKSKSHLGVVVLGTVTAVLTMGVLWIPIFGPQTRDLGDLNDHLLVVQHFRTAWLGNIYSLFFPLTYLLSFGSEDMRTISCVATVLLIASVVAKAVVTYGFVAKGAPDSTRAALVSLLLCLVMPLPNWWKPGVIYLDKIAPNVWFNATTILAMPFAIALFLSALRWLAAPTPHNFAWVALFSVFSVITKPNYVLAFIPLLGLIVSVRAVAVRNWLSIRSSLLLSGLILLISGILVAQYVACVDSGPWSGSGSGRSSHIAFAPFAVWSLYSPNIPASFLLSIAFPMTVTALYLKESQQDLAMRLAWAGLGAAVLQYALLAETGEVFPDQNWIWGSNVAMYLLFMASARLSLSQRRSWRFDLVALVFIFHVGAGIYYYLKLAFGVDYF